MKLFLTIFFVGFSCVTYAQKTDHNPNRDPIKPVGSTKDYARPPQKTNSIVIRDSNSGASQPLFILDGKVISHKEFSEISPNIIESVNTLKPESAIPIYGEKAKNGVIIIQTKKKLKKNKKRNNTEPILAI